MKVANLYDDPHVMVPREPPLVLRIVMVISCVSGVVGPLIGSEILNAVVLLAVISTKFPRAASMETVVP